MSEWGNSSTASGRALQAVREVLNGGELPSAAEMQQLPSPHQRLMNAWNDGSAGEADLAALVRHVLRQESEISGASVKVRARRDRGLPEPDVWVRHGCAMQSLGEDAVLLASDPWVPEWLPGAQTTAPAAAAFKGAERRNFKGVEGDPMLTAMGKAYTSYRSAGQRAAVRATITAPEGATLAVNLPTGAGKSLCAHLPSILKGGEGFLSVVVVPTVALALDQQRSIEHIISHPTAYHGGSDANEDIRSRIRMGRQRIVFTSPEGLLQGLAPSVFHAARDGYLKWLVIDEAHIVDQWGDDFRSAFQELEGLRQGLLAASATPFQTLLLSATFTEATLETLETLFGRPGPFDQVSAATLRPEPSYWWARTDRKDERKRWVVEAIHHLPRPLILYTSVKKDVKRWYGILRGAGYRRIHKMTGDTGRSKRQTILDDWRGDATDIVVATSAFGLGIDKSDVRSVVHACWPENIDRFYQEVGRGGRDGKASVSLLCSYENWNDREDDKGRARGINRKTILKAETAYERWDAMFGDESRTRVNMDGQDRYRVRVTVVPRNDMQNDTNKAWNIRTLLLMHRAGLATMEGEPPPRQREDETDADMRNRLAEYFDHRVVKLATTAPRDEELFRAKIEPMRERMFDDNERGFKDLQRLLSGNECVGDILASVYEIPRSPLNPGTSAPTTSHHVQVQYACGGCPSCRQRERNVYAPDGGIATVPTWERTDLHPSLEAIFGNEKLAIVCYGREDLNKRGWKRGLKRIIQKLVGLGIRRVVAPPAYSSTWREAWRRKALSVFVDDLDWGTPDPSTVLAIPDLVYIPTGTSLPPHCVHPPGPRLLLIPEGTMDPHSRGRELWDMHAGPSFGYQSFKAKLNLS